MQKKDEKLEKIKLLINKKGKGKKTEFERERSK